jgi:hypothetical protein
LKQTYKTSLPSLPAIHRTSCSLTLENHRVGEKI